MSEGESVNLPKPVFGRMEINLNTVLQIITLSSVLIGAVSIWANVSRDVFELKEWTRKHELTRHDNDTKIDDRFKAVEVEVRKIEGMGFRLEASERSNASVSDAVRALQEVVNKQGSDVRLALEILQRMEGRYAGSK